MKRSDERRTGGSLRVLVVALGCALSLGCGKDSGSKLANSGGDTGTGGMGAGGTGASDGPPGTSIDLTTTTVTTVDGSSITTSLPLLPPLTNVVGTLREDSVGIDFDPVDGATDYRVYVLPSDSDIIAFSDGTLSVKNAIYRCAGLRQGWDLKNNLNAGDANLKVASDYFATAKIAADAASSTLGYVYMTPGSGRSPVYAVAVFPLREAEEGWREMRPKIYTTSTTERDAQLAKGARDDGVAFYVPSVAGATTRTLFTSQVAQEVAGQGWTKHEQHYFLQADTAARQGDAIAPAAAFEILNAKDGADSEPLMRVFYSGTQSHDELSPGPERFKRAAYQGSSPLFHVEWSGMTGPTTLVVEALANGCPFQGFLSPQHLEPKGHQIFYTLDELQQKTDTGEAFINGQYDDVTGKPKPLARSFLKVTPVAHDSAKWDFYAGFGVGSDIDAPVEVPGCKGQNCYRWQTTDFDISAYLIEKPDNATPILAFGQFLGQLWEAFDDVAADTTGKLRFTARTKGNVDSDPNKYLHATLSVDIVSTDRRYPQLIITDQDAPVQEGFGNPDNNTILVQPITGPSMRLEVQAFHGLVAGLVGSWDVNNQAPEHRLIDYDDEALLAQPSESPFEHAGMDRMTTFDVFVSSQRLYAFMDGKPAGCTLLPPDVKFAGPVTLTIGDVLYHEGAPDELVCADARPYTFMHLHQCNETKRHFDDVAFKSASPPPAWDEQKFPCAAY